MTVFTAYYHAPVGILQLQCSTGFITAINFYNGTNPPASQQHPLLAECAQQLHQYFAGTLRQFQLPVCQTGTPFQQQVWQLLTTIPYGATASYKTLAKQFGNLKAVRAVAAANGKNSLVIVVPCHRVIGSNQSLIGYAGGLWRMQWLLNHEAKYCYGVQQLPFSL